MNLFRMTVERSDSGLVLTSSAFTLAVPPERAEGLSSGRAVTLGIRPSDIRIARESEPYTVEAKVEVVEYLGVEALVDLRAGGQEFIAQVAAAERPNLDQAVRAAFNPAGLRFFDTESGQAI